MLSPPIWIDLMDDLLTVEQTVQAAHRHIGCVPSGTMYMGEDRYMASPQFPPHPEGRQCQTCRMWMRDLAKEFVVRPEGLIPKSMWIAQGHPIIGQIMTTSAFCWLLPTWIMMSKDQYCAQHEYQPEESSPGLPVDHALAGTVNDPEKP